MRSLRLPNCLIKQNHSQHLESVLLQTKSKCLKKSNLNLSMEVLRQRKEIRVCPILTHPSLRVSMRKQNYHLWDSNVEVNPLLLYSPHQVRINRNNKKNYRRQNLRKRREFLLKGILSESIWKANIMSIKCLRKSISVFRISLFRKMSGQK